jgi:hypothetical protein
MQASDLTPAMTIANLWEVYETHSEPFESVNQCNVFLRAASMLRGRLPAESEGNGERVSLRDIESAMVEARKQRNIMLAVCRPATVIVAPDRLR